MVTQKQIADRLGISRQLVGFALNGGGTMSDEIRAQILATAKELGYHRNEVARAMVTGTNRVIGFLVKAYEIEAAARILIGALDGAADSDYSIKVLQWGDKPDIASIVQRCVELRVAGVITTLIEGESLNRFRAGMQRYGIPVAVVDSSFPMEHGIRVISDDVQGCRLVIEHLWSLGHRKIAFVSAESDAGIVALRERAFRTAMRECGLTIPPGYLVHGNWGVFPQADTAVHALLDHPMGVPTAIFCIDDKTAMAALRNIRQRGFRIPDDISVVGIANLGMASFADPPLTTVAQPFEQMGLVAVQQLLSVIAEQAALGGKVELQMSGQEVVLPTQLVVRASTAKARRTEF